VEDAILEQKKRELLKKYVSEELLQAEIEVKEMTGKI
jgi:hypothetical protein